MRDHFAEQPFTRIGPDIPASPVVLSVPHAGRNYSPALLSMSRLPREKLELLEDPIVDRLIWRAIGTGAVALIAHAPRAEIDLNRDEREVDPTIIVPPPPASAVLQSSRTRGGLGLIPSRIANAGTIWRQRLPASELHRRIEAVHQPYHAALKQVLHDARAAFGTAVLLDCHSMPPNAAGNAAQADIVLGDRHGTTIAGSLLGEVLNTIRLAGFSVACNVPYAGGYITSFHGRPREGVHALQIEIDRSLYLSSDLRTAGGGFDRVAQLLASIATALAGSITAAGHPMAAE